MEYLNEDQFMDHDRPDETPVEIELQPTRKSQAQTKMTRQQQFFKEAKDVLLIVALFMLIYALFFRTVVVQGDSMYDTLANGDRLMVINNFIYNNPKRGDVVVASKDSFRDGECIIKRIIATEGQIVDIDFTTGTVYVDGQALDEPYIYTPTKLPEGMQFPLVVDEGCVFVMGDNRMRSQDSRSHAIGLIDQREILGRAVFLIWPGTGSDDHPMEFDFGRIGVIN